MRTKIIFISTTSGTIKSFMLNHIKKLSGYFDVFICCSDADSLKKFVPRNVVLICINFKRRPNLISDMFTFFKILKFFLDKNPDFTISISPKAGFITCLASFISRVPNRIHWFTGQIWVTKSGLGKKFFKFLDKIIFTLSHHVLVDSSSQRNFLVVNKIISEKNSTVLHKGSVGGVDVRRFKFKKLNRNLIRKKLLISKESFVFLYLGRINKEKGIFELIEAFKQIQNDYNINLILVGPIEDKFFKKLIIKENKIIYIGHTNIPEKWFSSADILCLPSHREGFGSVIIESASCKLPSLGSKIYGIRDAIIKNQTGFFHKVGNINDIKKKMVYAIKNRDVIKKYGFKARKRVEKDFKDSLLSQKFFDFIVSRIV